MTSFLTIPATTPDDSLPFELTKAELSKIALHTLANIDRLKQRNADDKLRQHPDRRQFRGKA